MSALVPMQTGPTAPVRAPNLDDPLANSKRVKAALHYLGADIVGISEAPDFVWYSHQADGTPIVPYHRYAISVLIDQGYPTMEGSSGDAEAGRFGAHNIHENVPLPTAWHSDQIVLGTFFNGGLRAYDISNPYQPKEVGIFMPPAPPGAPTGTIQMNDVFVDERGIVYAVDRHVGGLYILEMDF
jgi:hypothetical protein